MHDGFLSAVKEVPLDTPSEAYDGMQMASLAARPGDVLVEAQSSSLMLSAHAVRRKDGGMAIVLINKHPTQAFVVDVAIPDLPLAAAGLRYDFGRANFSLNSPWPASGPSQTKIEGLAKTFSVTLAATSECVLLIPAK